MGPQKILRHHGTFAQTIGHGRAVNRCRRSFAQVANERDKSRQSTGHFDEETDVLIVGSGGAGLTAALRCNALSLRSIVVEKTDKLGGTTALSGGGMWIPNNPFLKQRGYEDSVEKALTYMNACIGDAGPASTPERRMAFVENAPRMLAFLRETGFAARGSGEYPSYYPDLPGGEIPRSVESVVFNAKKLGSWHNSVRQRYPPWPPFYTNEGSRLVLAATSLSNMLFAASSLGIRGFGRRLLGQNLVTMGAGLICQLLHLNLQRKTNLWLESPLEELITNENKVIGAVVNRGTTNPVRIRAHRGVLLVAGGFARNAKMREQHQEGPIGSQWTSAQPEDTGDAIRIAGGLDARLELMDDSWWGPTLIDPSTSERYFSLYERSLPHSIIVDSSGNRFMNESQSYNDAGHIMYQRNRTVSAIPSWLILDSNHRRKYPLANMMPGRTPTSAIDSGFVHKADTLEDLSHQIGIDSNNLTSTIHHFNTMARTGKDTAFHRGENAYDRFFGDPNVKPNGSLGPIEKPPFYAVQVWPGDLGTKGGLLTDEKARVVSTSGAPIGGLYAAGNSSASVMGSSYPGNGSTLAPALTFAFVAVNDMGGAVS